MSFRGPRGSAPDGGGRVRSGRLIATLSSAGAVAGLLIVLAYSSTLPAIEANRTKRIDAAIRDVLPSITRYETLYLDGDGLTSTPAPGVDSHELEKVYAGFDAAGSLVGFAISTVGPGFQDPIEVLVGFDPRTAKTLGLAIVSSRETPGLGDKIQGKGWLAQFAGTAVPLVAVKNGSAQKANEVDMITGATISSRAVIAAVNKSVARWTPMLTAFLAGGRP
jgi:electron transport complex protein RnfG